MITTYWKHLGTLQECEVIGASGPNCLIKFWDTTTLQFEELWVNRNEVVFPKFCEYGAL